MTKLEIKCKNILTPDLEKMFFKDKPFPTMYHCMGTDKLLGSLLGTAIAEGCNIKDKKFIKDITELSSFLRAYIVIDDYMKDNNISNSIAITDSLVNIRNKCIDILSKHTANSFELWYKYELNYNKAYHEFGNNSLYDGITNKCCPIFMVFELPKIKISPNACDMHKILKDYLFCLQMLDDFQDMEEDLYSPKNHNIYTTGKNYDDIIHIISKRFLYLKDMLNYVFLAICVLKMKTNSRTALNAFDHSIAWINNKLKTNSHLPSLNFFEGNLESFLFLYEKLKKITLKKMIMQDFKDIRAESMHTILN